MVRSEKAHYSARCVCGGAYDMYDASATAPFVGRWRRGPNGQGHAVPLLPSAMDVDNDADAYLTTASLALICVRLFGLTERVRVLQ
eukprot:834810-Pyramimonas_sp.AAC.2